jgi:hypothetical protein
MLSTKPVISHLAARLEYLRMKVEGLMQAQLDNVSLGVQVGTQIQYLSIFVVSDVQLSVAIF